MTHCKHCNRKAWSISTEI